MRERRRTREVKGDGGPRRHLPKRAKKAKEDDGNKVPISGGQVQSLNPLLVELVLERIFPYFESSPSSMKNLRLVSKLWDEKIVESLRNQTEIDILRLISPYPEGLGWTRGENQEGTYECPYFVKPIFPNIKVVGTCETLEKEGVIRWFETMGGHVKSLHFYSSLSCYHHTRFLECVLKVWCKNLKRLYLNGITWYTGLSHYSRFDDLPFLCNLKELIINAGPESSADTVPGPGDCAPGLSLKYLCAEQPDPNKPCKAKDNVLDRNPSLIGEIEGLLQKILVVIAEESVVDPRSNRLVSRIDSKLGTDGGILGNIMEHLGSEKVVIKNLPAEHCDAFLLSLIRKPRMLLAKLRHFEYENFPMFRWCWQLNSFRKLSFPITKLCFGPLFSTLDGATISSLLRSLSGTLQHLEFEGNVLLPNWETDDDDEDQNVHMEIQLPTLPHLKIYKNKNIFCTRTGSLDLVKNMPSLETCYLENATFHTHFYPLNPTELFNLLFQSANFAKDETHNLKELELVGKISFTRHVELLRDWFPNLKKFMVTVEGGDVFAECLSFMKHTEMEEARIFFYSCDNEWCNALLSCHVCDMSNLRFLELVHMSDNPFNLSLSTCEMGLGKAPKLTSLKLKNFSMFVDEREKIQRALSHISHVSFTDCVFQQRPTNFEFCVGVDVQFPAIDC